MSLPEVSLLLLCVGLFVCFLTFQGQGIPHPDSSFSLLPAALPRTIHKGLRWMHVPGEPELSPDALVTECALGHLSRASSSVRTSPADLLLPLANSPDGHSGHIAGR